MRAAYQPEAFGIVLAPDEMDVAVEVFRMFVRDYDTDERHEHMLGALEKAYEESGRELAGGRRIDMNYLLNAGEIVDQDDEDGGSAVDA
jgi:hypothetical protein